MSLPPGATLVSGSIPDTSQLPPGATLVSGNLPAAAQPGILDKANEYAGKALSAAGLPTSLSNVPDWFRHLTGTHPDSQPFWAPIREAIKNPTQENLVNAVPFIGPSSVAMSKDVRAGNYGGAAATLAGTIGGVALPTKAPEIAAGLSDTAQAIKDTPGAIADAAQNGLRDPVTGKLKPGVKTAAKVIGGVGGALPGALHGNLPAAYIGGEAGARTLPAIVDAATPVSAAQKQLAVDAAAMRTRNLQARVAESKAADAAGQTVPEYRVAQKAAAKAAIPATPEASPIITTQSPDIPSEGRPATWRNLSVSDLASKGGPLTFDAAKQAQLRQLGIPDVGLVADPRATIGGDAIGSSADRLARLREIAGYPSLKGGPGDFTSQAAEPKYLYRIRPVGEKGVPAAAANSPAQLTTSLEQAESWAPSKNEEGPHEIVRIPTSSLKPGQTSARPFSPEIDWHKALQAIPESDVEVVRPHQAEVESE